MSGLPSDSVASYESKSAMTIGFCLQVCQGVDPGFDNSSFMGIQVWNGANHRCKQVENPGEGVAQIFAWGGQGFHGKITWGFPILAFVAFLLTSFSKICLGMAVSFPWASLNQITENVLNRLM